MANQNLTIGFVGSPYKQFIEWLLTHGFNVVCFVERGSTEVFPPGIEKIIECDFTSKFKCYEDLKKLPDLHIDGFVVVYENAVLQKAWLCEWFKTPGLNETIAVTTTDKGLMRARFQEVCPELNPDFQIVTNWNYILGFMENHDFPVVLKPANLFKSLLVTKNNTIDELEYQYKKTISSLSEIYSKEKVNRMPSLVIEEFMIGPSFSVEVYADEKGDTHPISEPCDLVFGRDLGILDNFNYSRKLPSKASASVKHYLVDAAQRGVKALQLKSTPAHVELILTSQGPKIIEIGARNGGYRSRMYSMFCNIDLFQAQVDIALGKIPQLVETPQKSVAVYEIFALKRGKFVKIKNWETLQNLPSCVYSSLKGEIGKETGLSNDGFRAVAVIILAHHDFQQCLEDQRFVEQNISVVVS